MLSDLRLAAHDSPLLRKYLWDIHFALPTTNNGKRERSTKKSQERGCLSLKAKREHFSVSKRIFGWYASSFPPGETINHHTVSASDPSTLASSFSKPCRHDCLGRCKPAVFVQTLPRRHFEFDTGKNTGCPECCGKRTRKPWHTQLCTLPSPLEVACAPPPLKDRWLTFLPVRHLGLARERLGWRGRQDEE